MHEDRTSASAGATLGRTEPADCIMCGRFDRPNADGVCPVCEGAQMVYREARRDAALEQLDAALGQALHWFSTDEIHAALSHKAAGRT